MRSIGLIGSSEGATMEILQYVFLGLAIVSAGAGTALVVIGAGDSGGRTESARLRIGGSGLRLEF